MSICDRLDNVRDYAFGELPAGEHAGVERHVATCGECSQELDQLRVTTAALRTLPDREIPQRIGFVSDKVFARSAAARFFGGFWNSAARLGFASACVVAGALIVSAYHRPATEIRTVVAAEAPAADISKVVDAAVAKAVAQVRSEDGRLLKASLLDAERKHEQQHRNLMEAVSVMQSRQNMNTLLAGDTTARSGAGQ